MLTACTPGSWRIAASAQIKIHIRMASLVARIHQRNPHRQHILRLHAKVFALQILEASDEQTRTRKQNDTHSNLRDHKESPHSCMRA